MNLGIFAALCLLTTACSLSAGNSEPASFTTTRSQETQLIPRAGDVLLVPLNCYVCNAIESETGTSYSHAVVVANTTDDANQRFVFEAWGETKKTAYAEIVRRKQKKQSLFLLRPKNLQNNTAPDDNQIRIQFENQFAGLPFDDEYLWDNFDTDQREKLYCTEFVIKFINSFISRPVLPAPMSFSKNEEFWKKYYRQFGMTPPSGRSGASPATLFFSPEFIQLGELNDE